LEALKELAQKGVTVVIGPQSSAELALLKPYADAHDILLISQGSTASSLVIAGDNVFRLCPDDTLEAQAIVALMWHDGIGTLTPCWRGDAAAGCRLACRKKGLRIIPRSHVAITDWVLARLAKVIWF
jgi:branched-chain amino acid transport system substrate-binding protein